MIVKQTELITKDLGNGVKRVEFGESIYLEVGEEKCFFSALLFDFVSWFISPSIDV